MNIELLVPRAPNETDDDYASRVCQFFFERDRPKGVEQLLRLIALDPRKATFDERLRVIRLLGLLTGLGLRERLHLVNAVIDRLRAEEADGSREEAP